MDIIQGVVHDEMSGPGQLLGYSAMHLKIRQMYNLNVPRGIVHAAMYNENPDALGEKILGKKEKEKGHFSSPGPR